MKLRITNNLNKFEINKTKTELKLKLTKIN